jgi:drug/metabolite transporter (DMT)-like permease
MTAGILLALAAAVIYGFLGVIFEIAGKRQYKVWDVIMVKQFAGLCIGFACTALLRLSFLDWRLLGLGLIGAVAYVVTLAAYLVASREKNIATNWTIVNLSVVVPILLSVIWFGDAFTLTKGLGALLTILSIVLIGGASARASGHASTSSRWLACITVAFLLNGILVILFRFVPEREGTLFTTYFYGISFLLVAPYKLLADRTWKPARGLITVSVGGAITHWSGIMLTIAALAHVGRVSKEAGVIVYPITNGLVIPVGVILGVLLLKERMSRRTGIGVAVGVAALVCLFIR